jgi:hypothetical protein
MNMTCMPLHASHKDAVSAHCACVSCHSHTLWIPLFYANLPSALPFSQWVRTAMQTLEVRMLAFVRPGRGRGVGRGWIRVWVWCPHQRLGGLAMESVVGACLFLETTKVSAGVFTDAMDGACVFDG